jgi:hypothetical protein
MLEKYGTINSWLNITKKIIDTEQTLKTWYETLAEPKPSYGWLCKHFLHTNIVTLSAAQHVVSCYKQRKTSLEILSEELLQLPHYNRKPPLLSTNKRPDFMLDDSTYINVDGLYWHSERQKNKWYHYNLRKEFEDAGLRLFQFYENEIRFKPNVVLSWVNKKFNVRKINAGECTIKPVSATDAKDFFTRNDFHEVSGKYIGFFLKEDLVAVASYFLKEEMCVINKYCELLDVKIEDGIKVLSEYLLAGLPVHITAMQTEINLRYESDLEVRNAEFQCCKEILGYKWTDGQNVYDSKQKTNLWKIYDAGHRVFTKTII